MIIVGLYTRESRPNRRVDEETFGKRSIQEHARENRSYKRMI